MECQQCHGQVQEVGVLVERDPVWGGDNMGWCISCHVQEDAVRDCTVCHY
jgi:predicted CxxxxCH...CXXCH cytochrome family protein